MLSEQRTEDRDAALRAVLVERAAAPLARSESARSVGRDRVRVGIVSGVVLAVVVALSVLALSLGVGHEPAPAGGGIPSASTPAGIVLGRWTSADGPDQTHVIRPNGLAVATSFACSGIGKGSYLIHIPHAFDEGARSDRVDGRICSGTSSSSSTKGTPGSVTMTITSTSILRWTLVVVGIPGTYVTPRPVTSPKSPSGAEVRFCTGDDLTARYQRTAMPNGVTLVKGGQIVFTNTSATTCALAGYPQVRFLTDGGVVLGHHTMEHTDVRSSTEHGLEPVLLAPMGHAYSQIDYYLPSYYTHGANDGPCRAQTVHALRVDLGNSYAAPDQRGTFDLRTGSITACLDGRWGVDGKYGQLSSTVFVRYSNASKQ